MAKKKKAAAGEEEEAKGGKKKKIIIVVLVLVGLFGAKSMLMEPATPVQIAAAKAAKEQDLIALCERQNAQEHGEEKKHETPATTVAGAVPEAEVDPHTERGGVLEMEPLTVNLADGHYLKIGIALQLDLVTVAEEAKAEGLGAKALDMAIAALSTKTMAQLAEPKVREELKHKLGLDACQAYEGQVLTVYFTNFVMQ